MTKIEYEKDAHNRKAVVRECTPGFGDYRLVLVPPRDLRRKSGRTSKRPGYTSLVSPRIEKLAATKKSFPLAAVGGPVLTQAQHS